MFRFFCLQLQRRHLRVGSADDQNRITNTSAESLGDAIESLADDNLGRQETIGSHSDDSVVVSQANEWHERIRTLLPRHLNGQQSQHDTNFAHLLENEDDTNRSSSVSETIERDYSPLPSRPSSTESLGYNESTTSSESSHSSQFNFMSSDQTIRRDPTDTSNISVDWQYQSEPFATLLTSASASPVVLQSVDDHELRPSLFDRSHGGGSTVHRRDRQTSRSGINNWGRLMARIIEIRHERQPEDAENGDGIRYYNQIRNEGISDVSVRAVVDLFGSIPTAANNDTPFESDDDPYSNRPNSRDTSTIRNRRRVHPVTQNQDSFAEVLGLPPEDHGDHLDDNIISFAGTPNGTKGFFRVLFILFGALIPLIWEMSSLRSTLSPLLDDTTWVLLRSSDNHHVFKKDVILKVPRHIIEESQLAAKSGLCKLNLFQAINNKHLKNANFLNYKSDRESLLKKKVFLNAHDQFKVHEFLRKIVENQDEFLMSQFEEQSFHKGSFGRILTDTFIYKLEKDQQNHQVQLKSSRRNNPHHSLHENNQGYPSSSFAYSNKKCLILTFRDGREIQKSNFWFSFYYKKDSKNSKRSIPPLLKDRIMRISRILLKNQMKSEGNKKLSSGRNPNSIAFEDKSLPYTSSSTQNGTRHSVPSSDTPSIKIVDIINQTHCPIQLYHRLCHSKMFVEALRYPNEICQDSTLYQFDDAEGLYPILETIIIRSITMSLRIIKNALHHSQIYISIGWWKGVKPFGRVTLSTENLRRGKKRYHSSRCNMKNSDGCLIRLKHSNSTDQINKLNEEYDPDSVGTRPLHKNLETDVVDTSTFDDQLSTKFCPKSSLFSTLQSVPSCDKLPVKLITKYAKQRIHSILHQNAEAKPSQRQSKSNQGGFDSRTNDDVTSRVCVDNERCLSKMAIDEFHDVRNEQKVILITDSQSFSVTPPLYIRVLIVILVFSRWIAAETRIVIEMFIPTIFISDIFNYLVICSFKDFEKNFDHCMAFNLRLLHRFNELLNMINLFRVAIEDGSQPYAPTTQTANQSGQMARGRSIDTDASTDDVTSFDPSTSTPQASNQSPTRQVQFDHTVFNNSRSAQHHDVELTQRHDMEAQSQFPINTNYSQDSTYGHLIQRDSSLFDHLGSLSNRLWFQELQDELLTYTATRANSASTIDRAITNFPNSDFPHVNYMSASNDLMYRERTSELTSERGRIQYQSRQRAFQNTANKKSRYHAIWRSWNFVLHYIATTILIIFIQSIHIDSNVVIAKTRISFHDLSKILSAISFAAVDCQYMGWLAYFGILAFVFLRDNYLEASSSARRPRNSTAFTSMTDHTNHQRAHETVSEGHSESTAIIIFLSYWKRKIINHFAFDFQIPILVAWFYVCMGLTTTVLSLIILQGLLTPVVWPAFINGVCMLFEVHVRVFLGLEDGVLDVPYEDLSGSLYADPPLRFQNHRLRNIVIREELGGDGAVMATSVYLDALPENLSQEPERLGSRILHLERRLNAIRRRGETRNFFAGSTRSGPQYILRQKQNLANVWVVQRAGPNYFKYAMRSILNYCPIAFRLVSPSQILRRFSNGNEVEEGCGSRSSRSFSISTTCSSNSQNLLSGDAATEDDRRDEPTPRGCYVCMIAPDDAVMLPCMHGGSCINCGMVVLRRAVEHNVAPTCPLCRQPIRAIGRLETTKTTTFSNEETYRLQESIMSECDLKLLRVFISVKRFCR